MYQGMYYACNVLGAGCWEFVIVSELLFSLVCRFCRFSVFGFRQFQKLKATPVPGYHRRVFVEPHLAFLGGRRVQVLQRPRSSSCFHPSPCAPLCLLPPAGTPVRAVLEEQRRERPEMVVLRPAVLLFASASLMVSTLGFLAPKTSISVRSSGFLGDVRYGEEGRARGGGSVTSRREVDPSMRLGVSSFGRTQMNLTFRGILLRAFKYVPGTDSLIRLR